MAGQAMASCWLVALFSRVLVFQPGFDDSSDWCDSQDWFQVPAGDCAVVYNNKISLGIQCQCLSWIFLVSFLRRVVWKSTIVHPSIYLGIFHFAADMLLEDFERVKIQFGDDAEITQEAFLALNNDEAEELILRVPSLTDRGNLRHFRLTGNLLWNLESRIKYAIKLPFRSLHPFRLPFFHHSNSTRRRTRRRYVWDYDESICSRLTFL